MRDIVVEFRTEHAIAVVLDAGYLGTIGAANVIQRHIEEWIAFFPRLIAFERPMRAARHISLRAIDNRGLAVFAKEVAHSFEARISAAVMRLNFVVGARL